VSNAGMRFNSQVSGGRFGLVFKRAIPSHSERVFVVVHNVVSNYRNAISNTTCSAKICCRSDKVVPNSRAPVRQARTPLLKAAMTPPRRSFRRYRAGSIVADASFVRSLQFPKLSRKSCHNIWRRIISCCQSEPILGFWRLISEPGWTVPPSQPL